MTVADLIDRILTAYPGASPEAMATFTPVFHARFDKREGPYLAQAFNEVLATFKATARQPFPIPANIEAHMPSLAKPEAKDGGPPIREALERRDTRSRILLNDWLEGQGARIREARAQPLYAACLLEAIDQAKRKALDDRVTRILLDQSKLNECYRRAISSERGRRLGRIPKDQASWWAQLEEIARGWGLEITPAWWSDKAAETLTPKAEAA